MHSIRKFITASALFVAVVLALGAPAVAQTSYVGAQTSIHPNYSFPAQSFTAAATGTAIGIPGLVGGIVQLTATTLTTVSFNVQGSIDGGLTWTNLLVAPYAATIVPVATVTTATVAGLYVVNLANITNVRIVTSGAFTGTGVKFKLTGSPNRGLY